MFAAAECRTSNNGEAVGKLYRGNAFTAIEGTIPDRGHSPSGETEGGHSGDTERGHPRFRFPQGSKCGIYNLPVLNLLKPGDELYIAEGCSDCWALLSAGHKAIAIPSATLLSKKDMELLSALHACRAPAVTFHMYPDRDNPGERLFLQLQKVLPSLVHHQLPPGCKDYSEYYLQTKADTAKCPSGA